jgi:hypothetical protein
VGDLKNRLGFYGHLDLGIPANDALAVAFKKSRRSVSNKDIKNHRSGLVIDTGHKKNPSNSSWRTRPTRSVTYDVSVGNSKYPIENLREIDFLINKKINLESSTSFLNYFKPTRQPKNSRMFKVKKKVYSSTDLDLDLSLGDAENLIRIREVNTVFRAILLAFRKFKIRKFDDWVGRVYWGRPGHFSPRWLKEPRLWSYLEINKMPQVPIRLFSNFMVKYSHDGIFPI